MLSDDLEVNIAPPRAEDDDVFKDNGSSLKVVEAHVLQNRTIGVFGAVSLIVNKIIGSGYVFSANAHLFEAIDC